jgi:hypothetical protein
LPIANLAMLQVYHNYKAITTNILGAETKKATVSKANTRCIINERLRTSWIVQLFANQIRENWHIYHLKNDWLKTAVTYNIYSSSKWTTIIKELNKRIISGQSNS